MNNRGIIREGAVLYHRGVLVDVAVRAMHEAAGPRPHQHRVLPVPTMNLQVALMIWRRPRIYAERAVSPPSSTSIET